MLALSRWLAAHPKAVVWMGLPFVLVVIALANLAVGLPANATTVLLPGVVGYAAVWIPILAYRARFRQTSERR